MKKNLIKIIFTLFSLLISTNNFYLFGTSSILERQSEVLFRPTGKAYESKDYFAKLFSDASEKTQKENIKKSKSITLPKIPEFVASNVNDIIKDFSKINIIFLSWKDEKNPEDLLQKIYNLSANEASDYVIKFTKNLQKQIKMIKDIPKKLDNDIKVLQKTTINKSGLIRFKNRFFRLIDKISNDSILISKLKKQTIKHNKLTSMFCLAVNAGLFIKGFSESS